MNEKPSSADIASGCIGAGNGCMAAGCSLTLLVWVGIPVLLLVIAAIVGVFTH